MAGKSDIDYDVIVVGAGISGIKLAQRLQENNPNLSFCILEGRHEIGGTWSLFKYPGIRSDSDLFTFGFPWRPWISQQPIASGTLILEYLKESAEYAGLDKKIRLNHQVQHMSWSTQSATWTLNVEFAKDTFNLKCRFVFLCTGYYDAKEPLNTYIPGLDSFQGDVIHPQFWPEGMSYKNKNVVIIGSGATAITLLPSIAKDASHVIMLQRSPSYIISMPTNGTFERVIRACWPTSIAHKVIRLKWILAQLLQVLFCRWFPSTAKRMMLQETKKELPHGAKLDPDFTPSYNPWDQRVCLCPDGDFYECIRNGTASVKTGFIETCTATSIQLKSGEELHPDIIVTATGLKMLFAGAIEITVDGEPYDPSSHFMWKMAMAEDLPNVVFALGYVDASWTLGAEAAAQLACRLLKEAGPRGARKIVPRRTPDQKKNMRELPLLNLRSTYVKERQGAMPKCGDEAQWQPRSHYFKDITAARWGDIETGLEWS